VSEDVKPNEATQETAVSRREFGVVSLAAGLAAVAGAAVAEAAERPLTETDVTVKTPDGNCDAAFIHPTTGAYPGVLIWADVFGLRPDRHSQQPASSRAQDQSAHVFRYRRERRHAATGRKRQIEGGVRRGECAGRNRSLRKPAWLVRTRHAAAKRSADLQHGGRRACLGQAGGLLQDGAGLTGITRRVILPVGFARDLGAAGGCATPTALILKTASCPTVASRKHGRPPRMTVIGSKTFPPGPAVDRASSGPRGAPNWRPALCLCNGATRRHLHPGARAASFTLQCERRTTCRVS
jgi:hypothetical protein